MIINRTAVNFHHGLYDEPKESRKCPPQFVLDRIADEKLTGRFNIRKSNICQECYVAKSVNKTCNCT
jgi:hypothetical protein